jgi:hypothetical protein
MFGLHDLFRLDALFLAIALISGVSMLGVGFASPLPRPKIKGDAMRPMKMIRPEESFRRYSSVSPPSSPLPARDRLVSQVNRPFLLPFHDQRVADQL